MNFRTDINGLRAIAVIAVVLFHFNPSWLPGGFTGVDVFFVISGFLMTGIIFKGFENSSFNLFKFYVDRAYRIIPALALLCLVLLIFGWFYLTPIDYSALGEHAASSMVFLSNIIYLRESGYFDAASYEKWLLHTWSLSVEWQFYIIYPIILLILKKFTSIDNLKRLLLICTLLGFTFSIFATIKWPDSAYYLLPTRAWEMMFGGIAYLYPWNLRESKRKFIELIGLSLILLSYIFISSDISWPGHFALLPVLGTYLIIVANQQSSFITNNVVFQSLGKWSYSIYLWHWPVVVLGYYFNLKLWALIGIPISILLGYLSFRFVESVKLKRYYNLYVVLFSKPALMIFFVTSLSGIIIVKDGFFSRYDTIPNVELLSSNRNSAENYYRTNLMSAYSNNDESIKSAFVCTLDGRKQTINTIIGCLSEKMNSGGYLIIGDSHGRDFLHALRIAYPHENFVMLHQSRCTPTSYKSCFKLLPEIKKRFIDSNKKIKGIIFASLYFDESANDKFINEIKKDVYVGYNIYIANASVRLKGDIVDVAIKAGQVRESYESQIFSTDDVLPINEKINTIDMSRVEIFDKYKAFCNNNKCDLISTKNSEPYIWDGDHLTWLGIEKVALKISSINLLGLNSRPLS